MGFRLHICGIILFLLSFNTFSFAGNLYKDGGKIAWDKSNWAKGYYVYYGQNKDSLIFKQDVGNVLEYTLNNLDHVDSDHCWWVAVSAYNEYGEGNKCDPLLVCPYTKSYTLVWQESKEPDILGYQIYYRKDTEFSYSPDPLAFVTEPKFKTPPLSPGQTYYFMVYPVDKAGNRGAGTEISITPQGLGAAEEMDTTAPSSVGSIIILEEK